MQPAKLGLGGLHRRIKLIEELVAEETIVENVPLSPGVPERVSVALSWEIEPLRVTKLVALSTISIVTLDISKGSIPSKFK